MAKTRLSPEEIRKRLIRLRNVEYLHEQQRFKIWHLRDENRELKREVVRLKTVVSEQQKAIEDLKLQVEELRMMVFGKKKKKNSTDDDGEHKPPKDKTPRLSSSYRRPLPTNEEVTEIKNHPLDLCSSCGSEMEAKLSVIFYEEDVPISAKKVVRKHIVGKAYCPKCKKWHMATPLPNHKVVLGENIQKYICYLSIMCRLSFTQIQNILQDTYQIHVSQGEIAKILDREATHLRPFYERLKEQIRDEPVVHLDETGWRLFIDKDRSYAWAMSGAQSKESVFLVGESRGKGNAENLLGENYDGLVVTDDYVAYKKLKNHQLCWAHLIRKFRDLAGSKEIEDKQRQHCREEYAKLCLRYEDLKQNGDAKRYEEFLVRLTAFGAMRFDDPIKMVRLKTTLKKNVTKYLTCLTNPEIPLTNNQAERSLRHLVLKRKISFGSLTKRTAENLTVLVSVLLSLKQRYQLNFFQEYLRV